MQRTLALAGASLALAACSDPVRPPSPSPQPLSAAAPSPQEVFARYVALGTSDSQGAQSGGISAATQRAAWPAQLAARVGAPFSLPLVQDPGCSPPLRPPLAADAALAGAFGALGVDLVSAVMTTCAPLRAGVTLPTNSVAISGAKARDALHATPESEAARDPRTGTLYARVLAPGQTQVTAMLAQHPTFVSVELAANEVLPASTGLASAMTPYADWERDYDQILAAVRSTGARAVLVGVPSSAEGFPSIRRARELFAERSSLLALGVRVSASCARSSNHVFVPGYLLTLLSHVPATATCADVPGTVDYVLTQDDVNAIDARMAKINAHIRAKADEPGAGYAYFSLDALYALPKPRFSVRGLLFSSAPFGPNISLDGLHPSASGQGILAAAAARAIAARYGLAIP
jgi:hypothetical protein